LYTLAWQIAMVPVERLAAALNKANFPVFASLMKDPPEARAHFRTMVRTVAGIAFPAAAGIAIVGPEFIQLVLKPKWVGAIPVLRQLSILGAMRAVGIVVPSLISAAGKPRIAVTYNAICSVVYPLAFAVAAWRWGIAGVGWAWVILYPVLAAALIQMAIQRTPLEWGDILTPLKYPLLGTAVMCLAVVTVGRWIQLPPVPHVALQISVGVIVYGSVAFGWLWRTGRLSSIRLRALGGA
jgi:O-antigen/teichoic acid export membrane protein